MALVRRFAWHIGALVLAGLAGSIGWIYTHPPLRSFGSAIKTDQHWRTYALDISNEGRWPLTLTGITVNGAPVRPPLAVAAGSFLDGEAASSVLMRLEERGYLLETGPVPGWRVAPFGDVSRFTYALRLLLKPESPPAQVTVSYRYLGLPMRFKVNESP